MILAANLTNDLAMEKDVAKQQENAAKGQPPSSLNTINPVIRGVGPMFLARAFAMHQQPNPILHIPNLAPPRGNPLDEIEMLPESFVPGPKVCSMCEGRFIVGCLIHFFIVSFFLRRIGYYLWKAARKLSS
jgi:hypothetical protein